MRVKYLRSEREQRDERLKYQRHIQALQRTKELVRRRCRRLIRFCRTHQLNCEQRAELAELLRPSPVDREDVMEVATESELMETIQA